MSWWERFNDSIYSKNNKTLIEMLSKVSIKKTRDREGNGLLHYAARTRNKFLANYLLDAGCDIELKNNSNTTPLMVAVQCNQVVMVRLLIKAGADLEQVDEYGHTPLQISLICHQGNMKKLNLKIIQILINSGSNVNKIFSNFNNESPLHYVVRCKCCDILDLLLKAGALVDGKNKNGQTPLHYAIEYNIYECVEKLIKAGAEINHFDHIDGTYLHQAASNFLPDILELLLDNGAIVNRFNSKGDTPLIRCLTINFSISSSQSSSNMMDYLLEIFEPYQFRQRIRCVQILLEYGADVNLRKRRNELCSALSLSLVCHHSKIVNLLIEHGATFDYNIKCDLETLENCVNYNTLIQLMKSFVLSKAQNLEKMQLKFYDEFLKGEHCESLKEKLYNLYLQCSTELTKMKNMQIYDSVTLFQLMIQRNFGSYMRNNNVVRGLENYKEQIITNYPIYGSMIYERFDNELSRQNLLNSALLGLGKILNWSIHSLPSIFENILYYLNKRDLKNLASLA